MPKATSKSAMIGAVVLASALVAAAAGIFTWYQAQAEAGFLPQPECSGPGLAVARQADPTAQLAASFATTVQQFVTWEETRNASVKPTSPARRRDPGERLVMCYYDGTYTGIPTPPRASTDYSRMIVAVMADGSTRVVTVGPKATNPLTGPTP